jgi:hypothetical protein
MKCPTCQGRGKNPWGEKPCSDCHGAGFKIEVNEKGFPFIVNDEGQQCCASACQLSCQSSDQITMSCTTDCEVSCQMSQMSCALSCEMSCQARCEMYKET